MRFSPIFEWKLRVAQNTQRHTIIIIMGYRYNYITMNESFL